jgi:hypothetical protein
MLPMWFFIVLMGVIAGLLYMIRTSEETLAGVNKNQIRRLQFWSRNTVQQNEQV